MSKSINGNAYKVLDIEAEYDGIIIDGMEFRSVIEADAYMVEQGIVPLDDERAAYEVHEWSYGTWLTVHCQREEW